MEIKDFILLLLGGLIGVFMDRSWDWIRGRRELRRSRKAMCRTEAEFAGQDFVSLDHAGTFYDMKNINAHETGEKFFCSIPAEQLERMRKKDPGFCSREDSFFGKSLEELGTEMGFPGFAEAFEQARWKVADDFVRTVEADHTLFNGEKLGIREFVASRSGVSSDNEENILSFNFFKTDYFTHKVMHEVYRMQRQLDEPVIPVKFRKEEINRFYPFMTSLGINTLIVLVNGIHYAVLSKRSKYLSNMNGEALWHVSMNEGVTAGDVTVGNRVDLQHAAMRGLSEELGLEPDEFQSVNNKFYDVFMDAETFEMGISSRYNIDCTQQEFEEDMKNRNGKDNPLEIDEYCYLRFAVNEINRFIRDNKVTKECEYLLRMLVNREY